MSVVSHQVFLDLLGKHARLVTLMHRDPIVQAALNGGFGFDVERALVSAVVALSEENARLRLELQRRLESSLTINLEPEDLRP